MLRAHSRLRPHGARHLRTLTAFFEIFQFLRRRRECIDAQRAAERQHQLAMFDKALQMFETLTEGQTKQAAEQAAALIEIAKANAAQAETFATWLKSFQTAEAPTSSVVREDDEFAAEQQRMFEQLGISPDSELPAEFKLALRLQQGITDLGASAPA
jgi:hypothetical protein